MAPIALRYDALLTPTAPGPAPRGLESTGDPYFCAPWSHAGMPSIALPSGIAREGLPLSLQLVGGAFAEARLLGAAAWCESHPRLPGGAACLTSRSTAGSRPRRHRRAGAARGRGHHAATASRRSAISRASAAGRTLDVAGLTVTPGFIDIHSHSDWRLWGNRRAESKIRQGVTTEVVGNCGFSPAPVSDEFHEEMRGFALYVPEGMDFSWRSIARLSAPLRGRAASRSTWCSSSATAPCGSPPWASRGGRPPRASRRTMERLMDESMADGAAGLATGLIYAPGSYAATDEIVGIAKRAGARGAASTRATSAARARPCWMPSARPSRSGARAACRCR